MLSPLRIGDRQYAGNPVVTLRSTSAGKLAEASMFNK